MKPMKAFKYAEYGDGLGSPFFVQPKLNGIRALFSSGIWQSNDEKVWKTPVLRHLTEQLKGVCPPEWILDGELYCHGKSLQQINSAISINRNEPSEKTEEIEYHVFDVIDTAEFSLTFEFRARLLNLLSERLIFVQSRSVPLRIRIVPTTRCNNPSDAEHLYGYYRGQGYEGLMYRQADAGYGFAENCGNKENRWKCLLKRKDWLDDEFEITGFNITEGEKGEQGFQLWCKAKNGRQFAVGSGLSDAEVRFFAAGGPTGSLAKIKYEMLSDEGIPLKPTIECILEE